MTTTPQQTNAQRLADELDRYARGDEYQRVTEDAVIELRRLDAALADELNNRDVLDKMLTQCITERDQLARWKSTNAPRLEALEGLLADARAEAAKGAEAISSLASEREANAILTAENDQLRAQVERLQGGEPVAWMAESKEGAVRFTNIGLSADELEEYGWAITPLYTAQSAAPQMVALTDEQLWKMRGDAKSDPRCRDQHWFVLYARAIEAHHGIGQPAGGEGKP